MAHVVRTPSAPFPIADASVWVHQIPDAHDNLVWLLEDTDARTAAVVDGPGARAVEAFAEARGLTVTTILNTHTHPDHIGINLAYQRLGRLDEMTVYGARTRADEIPGCTHPVGEGDAFTFAGVPVRVMEAPGHIDGHISFVVDGAVFCGDTMFAGGCGYLFDGPASLMRESLSRLAALPPETRVCCAHEYTQDNLRFAWMVEPEHPPLAARIRDVWSRRAEGACVVPSTIGMERETNPFLRWSSPTLRAEVSRRMALDADADDEAIFAATRALKDRGEHKAAGDDPLPLTEPRP